MVLGQGKYLHRSEALLEGSRWNPTGRSGCCKGGSCSQALGAPSSLSVPLADQVEELWFHRAATSGDVGT